jgi:transposase-like protein
MSRRSGNYPKELRERAVRMVAEIRSDHSSATPMEVVYEMATS